MHAYYARGEKKLAAEALVGMLISEIAPRSWWAICLIDSIPLLEGAFFFLFSFFFLRGWRGGGG